MNFTITLRQAPLRLAGHSVSQLTKSTLRSSTPFRAFHQAAKTRSSASAPLQSAFFFSSTNAFRSGASSSPLKSTLLQQARGYAQYRVDEGVVSQVPPQSVLRRLLIGTAVFGGTLLVVNGVFNRETREDGGMPPYERSYLNSAFLHTGIGVATIGLAARQMVNTGFVYRMMITSPWIVALAGLGLSFGTMIGTRAVAPDNYIPKYGLWTAFNVTQAALIAPLVAFFPSAILARAGLYTVAMMGGISFVGATAKQEKYLYMGGPLVAGAAIVMASGLAPLVIPATALRTLALTESIWLYGGLALFGAFTLYDVQRILYRARLAERGAIRKDPVNEAISLELDFLNIFIRMVQILGMQRQRNNR